MFKKVQYRIRPNIEELGLQRFINELNACCYDEETIAKTYLALEEVLTNVVKYSGTQKPIVVIVDYSYDQIVIEIADEGKAFNFLKDYTPELDKPIETRKVGGLGIHLTKSIGEEIFYKRISGFNVLRIIIKAKTKKNSATHTSTHRNRKDPTDKSQHCSDSKNIWFIDRLILDEFRQDDIAEAGKENSNSELKFRVTDIIADNQSGFSGCLRDGRDNSRNYWNGKRRKL
jgi:serine/threonine-protein kinase RsbW